MRPRPFDTKFKLSNSGLFYLVVIGLAAAVASNVFRKDEHALLAPVLALIVSMLVTLLFRNWRSRRIK